MNKYNLKDFLENKLQNYKSTFRDTSFDNKNNRYLCQDNQTKVYDFDKYILKNYIKTPASPDAIYIGDKKFYFVEFKNSIPSNIKTSNIQNKFISGTKILQNLLKEFTPRDNKFIFCVVYKSTISQPKYFNSYHIEANITKFGLEEENKKLNNFYDSIITEDIEYYKNNFKLHC